MFTTEAIGTVFASRYNITNEADRMGYRLEGPRIQHIGEADIVSDALCLGAIQIPGHGMPIIMLADRQTTGGYAKIGAVIGPDIPKLAQACPGVEVRFRKIDDSEAVEALRQEENNYQAIARLLQGQETSVVNTTKQYYKVTVNGVVYEVASEKKLR